MAHRSNQQTTGGAGGTGPGEGGLQQPNEPSRPDSGAPAAHGAAGVETPTDGPMAGTEAKAHELGEKAREKSQELKAGAEEKARELGSMARRKVDEAGQVAGRTVAEGASRAGDRLRSVAGALRAASDRLEDEGEGWLAGYARDKASQVDRMSGYLGREDAGRMVSDLEQQARSRPAAFLGGTLATGFMVGRFLRASGGRAEAEARAGAVGHAHPDAGSVMPPAAPPAPGGLPHGPSTGHERVPVSGREHRASSAGGTEGGSDSLEHGRHPTRGGGGAP